MAIAIVAKTTLGGTKPFSQFLQMESDEVKGKRKIPDRYDTVEVFTSLRIVCAQGKKCLHTIEDKDSREDSIKTEGEISSEWLCSIAVKRGKKKISGERRTRSSKADAALEGR